MLARTNVSRFNDQGTIDRQESVRPQLILRVPIDDARLGDTSAARRP